MTSKIYLLTVFVIMAALFCGCGGGDDPAPTATVSKFPAQPEPGDIPQLLAPGIVSTRYKERDAAVSPDGREFYFTMSTGFGYAIVFTKERDGKLTPPEVASFSGKYSDLEPAFSPDGKRLYFVSNRPLEEPGEPKDHDIWYVEREGAGWGTPVNIGEPINSDKNEYYPSIAKSGAIYYTAPYEGAEDIFRSRLIDGEYQPPERLSEAVNSEKYEFNAFIDPDEHYIIFTSYGRDDDLGGGDLYISFRSDDDTWSDAAHMGDMVNSPALDYCPCVTADGQYLFYTSKKSKLGLYPDQPLSYKQIIESLDNIENGQDNIYWVNTGTIEAFKKK